MSRAAIASKALAFVLLVFVALFATQASAKYIKSKPSEFELQLPLACPDSCGIWCNKCPVGDIDNPLIGTDEDGNIILNPDAKTNPSSTTTLPTPSSTSKPQTGGPLELGDEDSVAQPNPHGTGGGDDESRPIASPEMLYSTFKVKRSALSRRQTRNDIIKGDVSRPETWGAGPRDWWSNMNAIIEDKGLILDETPRSSALMEYFDTDELDMPQTLPGANRAGGVPALRGSTLFVAVSNLGIYTGHFWESPNFVAIKNDTSSQDGQGLMWHPERQMKSWMIDVKGFMHYGTFDWQNATEISDKYRWVGNSPALRDLVRPGMILDEKSTQWREFRLFQPRDPHRGPPGTVAKNEKKMNELRTWLASFLNLKEEQIVRHAPFYEPNGPVDRLEGPHKPNDYHNTFTWQYGPPVNKSSTQPDADREFRATFNGETIVDMSRTWRSSRLLNNDQCRLRVTVFAGQTSDPDQESMGLRVSVIQPGEKLAYDNTRWSYPVLYVTNDDNKNIQPIINLGKNDTGLEEDIRFSFTRGEKKVQKALGQRPNHEDWHIEFQYGEGEDQKFKYEDMDTDATAQCRGGAWKLLLPYTVFQRESVCRFKCGVDFTPDPPSKG